MKVICQKNCSKKTATIESKKQMAHIGANAFISKTPSMQIEVLKCERSYKIVEIKR